jgi:hypothetical protein
VFEGAAGSDGCVEAAGYRRCRDQIMADTLVERLTGQASATDVNAEVQIVVSLDVLLDALSEPRAVARDVS